jgi:hypothetical protein
MTTAALLPASWPKRLVDTTVERLTDKDLAWAEVALISGMHAQHEHLLAIVERWCACGLRTVVSGPITSMSDAALKTDQKKQEPRRTPSCHNNKELLRL